MVLGSGMMAQAFEPGFGARPDVVVFASGVSNSLETSPAAFQRERDLLARARDCSRERLLVYFGTCSVEDPDRRNTPYIEHKLQMEALLADGPGPWMVLRLPLAIGPGHRGPTLARMLHRRISRGEHFEVWKHATRYPIDIDDVVRIAARLIDDKQLWNRRINIALRSYPVLEFVRVMEAVVGGAARYTLVDKGEHYVVNCPELSRMAGELDLDFRKDYLERTLRKYFACPADTPALPQR